MVSQNECKTVVTFRPDQMRLVRKLKAKRQLSNLFGIMLDVLEEGMVDHIPKFKERVKKLSQQVD
jgi:hypothetical protein